MEIVFQETDAHQIVEMKLALYVQENHPFASQNAEMVMFDFKKNAMMVTLFQGMDAPIFAKLSDFGHVLSGTPQYATAFAEMGTKLGQRSAMMATSPQMTDAQTASLIMVGYATD